MQYDLYFHYITIIRMMLFLKNNKIQNPFIIPCLIHLALYFSIRKLENKDDAKLYNYLYLLKFFFGLNGYITNYKSVFILNKTYYDFQITAVCFKQKMYSILEILSYDLLPASLNTTIYLKNAQSLVLIFWDMNLFTEKKTSLGLFDLLDPINYQFTLNTGVIKSNKSPLLLNELKIIIPISYK